MEESRNRRKEKLKLQKNSELYKSLRPAIDKIAKRVGISRLCLENGKKSCKREVTFTRNSIIYLLRACGSYRHTYQSIGNALALDHSTCISNFNSCSGLLDTKDSVFLPYFEIVYSELKNHGLIYPIAKCENCIHYEPEDFLCCYRTPHEIDKMEVFERTTGPDFCCNNYELDKNA